MIILKSEAEIGLMRRAGSLVWHVLDKVGQAIRPGVTTRELDAIAENTIREAGAEPSFKGYHGYPASICASVNEQVIHGIPGERRLVEGDIIGIDVGAVLDGYHGDSARTFAVGAVSSEAARLLRVTEESLTAGIEAARAGNTLGDVGHAVQSYAEANGFSVVRDFVGHGIGRKMHEEPAVPNYGRPGLGKRLRAGMVLAIEPMINAGGYEVEVLGDNWTAVTRDGSLSAHFEHTVAITEDGPVVLTLP
ncbi:MAG: Methionine aminopeptidase 1 [Firmicutes bacterium ADurb.Bin506]|jgi:methionyl aminopeptidase|nr:MAG: Methionine aminopeptidase 1 [Firmicutes bacterium ADurb.Bin506]